MSLRQVLTANIIQCVVEAKYKKNFEKPTHFYLEIIIIFADVIDTNLVGQVASTLCRHSAGFT